MGDSLADELAALRARAYGPDADIHDDSGAIARLRRLEDEVRVKDLIEVPPPTAAPTVPAPRAVDPTASAPGAEEGLRRPEPEAAPAPAPPTPLRRRASARQLAGACAIAALAAAAVTVPITLWAAALPDQPYAILHPIDAPPNTVFFSPESEAQRYEDFLGMRISTGALDYQQGRCILIELQPEEDSEFDSGATRGACSAPGFEAVADVSAAESSLSETARAALGDITAIRFAVVGDEVHVFVAREPVPTPTPES